MAVRVGVVLSLVVVGLVALLGAIGALSTYGTVSAEYLAMVMFWPTLVALPVIWLGVLVALVIQKGFSSAGTGIGERSRRAPRFWPKVGLICVREDSVVRSSGEKGQTTAETAVLIALCGLAVIAAIFFFRGSIADAFKGSSSQAEAPFRPPAVQCDPNYSGACVPSPPPQITCADLIASGVSVPFAVTGSDPQNLDPDGDGIACN